MKTTWKELCAVVVLSLLLPGLLLNAARLAHLWGIADDVVPLNPKSSTMSGAETMIRVKRENGVVESMELEEYLVGVVLGEMPADFELEALKAQAVVARTYTLRMCGNRRKHPDADICTQANCCQGYRDGDNERIRIAVEATEGQVLTFDGKLIEATYFSSAGGRTEDAAAVWGSDVPYLQSTDSPEDAYADRYLETVTFTAAEFEEALGIPLVGPCETWLGAVTYTAGGGVDTMVIGDTVFQGTELRKLLGIRSTAMIITAVGDHITITTRGYGHRVGMSQYGAEAMAVDGATYEQILAHYYQGTTLELFVDKDSSLG